MSEPDYEALGLVAGLEIHQQLDTETKLFCNCPTDQREPDEAVRTLTRYLHPTASELGELDEAALEESRVDREFEYLAYDSTCLVEEDDEPPGRLNTEAMETTLKIAKLLDMRIVDQVHVMRKLVIDGSNTSGFQRTALVATDGEISTDAGPVSIDDLMLEEESAQRIEATERGVRYSLDRLGVPLVEIGTGPDITTPEQAREAAEQIGMLLRSTGDVKRGLGTIRQDVNVSIEAGARVELKGVQQLDDIDDIVRLEVDRQLALLEIAEDLNEREARVGDPIDVTDIFEGTDSSVIQGALSEGGTVQAFPLPGFDGLLGREIQPDRRLGTELSDHAKRHGAGGIFHTDELPAYGITADEIASLRDTVGAGETDAVAIVAAPPDVADTAIAAVADRAKAAISGVPEETRDVTPEGTSQYLRPLPGAARMYPETDVPPVEPEVTDVELPELLTEKVARYQREFDLDEGLADQIAYSPYMPTFEAAIEAGVEPTLAATTLTSTLTELRRDEYPVDQLTETHLLDGLTAVDTGDITRDGLRTVLAHVADSPDTSVEEAIESAGIDTVDRDAVHDVVTTVIERNEEQVQEEGMAAFSGLMGECMAELRGNAEGEVVSDILREEIQRRS